MTDVLTGAVLLAAQGARGNPNGTSGVIVILAIVAIAAIGGLLVLMLFRRGRARPRAMERHPAPDGQVGRISEFRDGETEAS